uniref:dCTP pyrophosphatase 1 n=1 Tax=Spermophilus dauricus TaxID=99837 RepID=A0A8C9UR62_SPEDA
MPREAVLLLPPAHQLQPGTQAGVRCLHAEFAAERDWDQLHQPGNLLLALVGEEGELAELFQWKSDAEPGPKAWPLRERAALQEELSDVLIYLVALAAHSRKYTDLSHGAISEDQTMGPADLDHESSSQTST